MRNYELTCLISPELSLEESDSFQQKIISLIQEEKGILGRINKAVKKNLAYPIKNKNEAIFLVLNFQLNPEVLGGLERKIKAESQILRCLLLAKEEEKARPEIKEFLESSLKASSPKTADSKVELKKIEEKLEEILGE